MIIQRPLRVCLLNAFDARIIQQVVYIITLTTTKKEITNWPNARFLVKLYNPDSYSRIFSLLCSLMTNMTCNVIILIANVRYGHYNIIRIRRPKRILTLRSGYLLPTVTVTRRKPNTSIESTKQNIIQPGDVDAVNHHSQTCSRRMIILKYRMEKKSK